VERYGKVWIRCGEVWKGGGRCGKVWKGVEMCGKVWKKVWKGVGVEKVWTGLERFGKVREGECVERCEKV
jgi:hypothetical protein